MKQFFTLICASFFALANYGQDVIEVHFDNFDEDPVYTPADTTVSRRTGHTIITPANWLVKLEHDTYRFSFNFYGEDLAGTYSLSEGNFLEDYTFGMTSKCSHTLRKLIFNPVS